MKAQWALKKKKTLTLLTAWFWISSLSSCEKINCCCLSHPVWYLVMAALLLRVDWVPQSLSLGHTPSPSAYPSLIFPVPLSQGLVSFDCCLILYIYFSEASSQDLWISQLLNSSLRCYWGFCLPVVLLLGNFPSLIPCISSRTVSHNICLLSIEHPSGPSFF